MVTIPFFKIKTRPPSGQEGITIIELMIYMSIITIVLVVMTNFVIDVSANGAKTRISKEVQQGGQLILNRLTHDIRSATEISPITQPGLLQLVVPDGTPDGNNVTYQLDNQDVTYDDDYVVSPTVVNPLSVRITQFVFSQQDGAVTIVMTVEQASTTARSAERAQSTLTSSVVPRRSIY